MVIILKFIYLLAKYSLIQHLHFYQNIKKFRLFFLFRLAVLFYFPLTHPRTFYFLWLITKFTFILLNNEPSINSFERFKSFLRFQKLQIWFDLMTPSLQNKNLNSNSFLFFYYRLEIHNFCFYIIKMLNLFF